MVRVRLEGLPDEVQRIADAMQAAGVRSGALPRVPEPRREQVRARIPRLRSAQGGEPP